MHIFLKGTFKKKNHNQYLVIVNYQDVLMLELSRQQQFVSNLSFQAYDKAIYGIADLFWKPNFLVRKSIQYVFVKFYNRSSYVE